VVFSYYDFSLAIQHFSLITNKKKEQNEISDLITTQIDKLEQEKNGITDKIEGIEISLCSYCF